MFKLRYENINNPFWVQSYETTKRATLLKDQRNGCRQNYLQREALCFLHIKISKASVESQRVEIIKYTHVYQPLPEGMLRFTWERHLDQWFGVKYSWINWTIWRRPTVDFPPCWVKNRYIQTEIKPTLCLCKNQFLPSVEAWFSKLGTLRSVLEIWFRPHSVWQRSLLKWASLLRRQM